MKFKTLLTFTLLVFVFGSVVFLIAKECGQIQKKTGTNAGPSATGGISATEERPPTGLPRGSHKVIAYYFHGVSRCPSCMKIEAYTKEAINSGLGQAIKDGRLEWRVVNIEERGNEHFVKDFQLYTKSVVMVDLLDGKQKRWKNLEKVWELLHDKNAFMKYIRTEIGSYLGPN